MPASNFACVHGGESERNVIVDAYSRVFGLTSERSTKYIDKVGIENFRTVLQMGQCAAEVAFIGTAHWFAGKPVEATNIGHVAVLPPIAGWAHRAFALVEDHF